MASRNKGYLGKTKIGIFAELCFILILVSLLGLQAHASSTISLQMRVKDSTGQSVNLASTTVTVKVFSQNNAGVQCLLREESFDNQKIVNGYLAVNIGSGVRSASDPNKDFKAIFSNMESLNGLDCYEADGSVSGQTTYSPSLSDTRIFKVSFLNGSDPVSISFSNRSVPTAIVAESARDANLFSGKSVSDFVQIPSGQTNYQARLNELVSDGGNAIMSQILGGTYSIANNRVTGLGPLATMSVTGTPSASTYLRGDGTWATVSGGGGGGGSVTSVSGTAPIQVATGTTTPVVSIDDATTTTKGAVQVGAGLSVASGVVSLADTGTAGTYGSNYQVPVLTTDAKGRITGVTVTSITINGSAITAGTVDKARLPSDTVYSGQTSSVGIGGSPTSSAQLTVTSSTSGFLMPRMTGAQRDAIVSPVNGLQIYNTDSNQINFYNGSSWQALGVAGAGISSLTAGNGLTGGTLTTSGTIAVDVGTTANKIVQLDGSGKLPAVDGSQLTGILSASGWTNYSVLTSNGSGALTAVPGSSAGQMLNWTVTGPAWTSATFPSSTTANQLLYSSANNVVGGLTSANNSVLVTDGSGAPNWSALSADNFTQYALLAGRSGGQTINGGTAASNNLTLESTSNGTKGNIILNSSSGNVGIGTTNPVSKLEVNGQIRTTASIDNSSGTSINWDSGNVQFTTASCGAFTFSNMRDGGSYTLVVRGTTSGTCTFSQSSPDALSNSSFRFVPANGPTVSGTETVFTFVRTGPRVYVSWISGYN